MLIDAPECTFHRLGWSPFRLTLERVRKLHEELAIELFETIALRQLAVVAVADEHHRLPVEFVGQQRRAAEAAALRRHRIQIEQRVARRRDVLRDSAREESRGERVSTLDTRYARIEQPLARARGVVEVQPALRLHERECQMLRRIDRRADVERGPMTGARIREVDLLAQRPIGSDLREHAGLSH